MFAIGIFDQQQNSPGAGEDVHHTNGSFDETAAAPFQDREAEDRPEREHTGADEGEGMLAAFKMRDNAPGVERKGKGNAAGGNLGQGDAHEYETAQQQIDA